MLTKPIADITLDDVRSVYNGAANKCACGCKGKHRTNPRHIAEATKNRGYAVTDDEISEAACRIALAKVKKSAATAEMPKPEHADFGEWVCVTVGTRWTIIYLREGVRVARPVQP